MNLYTTELMPKGYTLIRYHAFCWGWKTKDYISLLEQVTAGAARRYAERHAKEMREYDEKWSRPARQAALDAMHPPTADVLPHSENCNHRLAREDKAYPRTCALCKLGPCAFRVRAPLPAPEPPPCPPPPRSVDARAFPRPDPYAACPLTIGGKPFTAGEFYNR